MILNALGSFPLRYLDNTWARGHESLLLTAYLLARGHSDTPPIKEVTLFFQEGNQAQKGINDSKWLCH